ncbi:MAG: hypothetical protein Q6368_010805 [Candidatus Baldrarchaeota archaeon]
MTRGSKAFFSSATHLGLMATPKRDDHVDTYACQYKIIRCVRGIEDGFLVPCSLG